MGCHVGEDTRVINISVETIYKALQEFKAVQKTAKTRPSVNYAKDWLDHSFLSPGLKKSFTLDVITRGQ